MCEEKGGRRSLLFTAVHIISCKIQLTVQLGVMMEGEEGRGRGELTYCSVH